MQVSKKITNVSEVQLVYRSTIKASDRPKISSSKDAAAIFRQFWDEMKIEHVESFKVMLLSRANKVLGISSVSEGGISGTVADPKVIFQVALKANASSIIVAHNHPSGNLNPSEADRQLTTKLKEAGKFLDIPVLDHIILIPEEDKYFSFSDEGLP